MPKNGQKPRHRESTKNRRKAHEKSNIVWDLWEPPGTSEDPQEPPKPSESPRKPPKTSDNLQKPPKPFEPRKTRPPTSPPPAPPAEVPAALPDLPSRDHAAGGGPRGVDLSSKVFGGFWRFSGAFGGFRGLPEALGGQAPRRLPEVPGDFFDFCRFFVDLSSKVFECFRGSSGAFGGLRRPLEALGGPRGSPEAAQRLLEVPDDFRLFVDFGFFVDFLFSVGC